jgi:hypothetical protein
MEMTSPEVDNLHENQSIDSVVFVPEEDHVKKQHEYLNVIPRC